MKAQMIGALVLMAAVHGLLAQTYSIRSYTIGGGGASTAKGYALNGTIGQPDAGSQKGGAYSLSGGFWSVAAVVSSDDSPALRILPAGRSVVLAWPDPSTGFQLQQSASLTLPVWNDVRSTPAVVGTEKQVTLPLQPGSQFFRLRQE